MDREKAIREREAKATKGPWGYGVPDAVATEDQGYYLIGPHLYQDANKGIRWKPEDAVFIAAAREDIPYLLAELEKAQERDEIWREKKKMLENDLGKAWAELLTLRTQLAEAEKDLKHALKDLNSRDSAKGKLFVSLKDQLAEATEILNHVNLQFPLEDYGLDVLEDVRGFLNIKRAVEGK